MFIILFFYVKELPNKLSPLQDYTFDVISAFIQTEFNAIREKILRKTLKCYKLKK